MPRSGVESAAEPWSDPASQGQIPSAWAQAYPRAVTLGRGGMLVPAATLRVLLGSGKTIPLGVVGFSSMPWLGEGAEIQVRSQVPAPGDLALCDIRGWAEFRRILAKTPAGTYRTGLDVLPGVFEDLGREHILGIGSGVAGAGDLLGRVWARCHPVASRLGAWTYWWRKIGQAPGPQEDEVDTIGRKYAWQVQNYQSILQVPLGDWTRDVVARHVPPGGSLLVPGCGVGREALHLARLGYKVLGVDLIPAMVEASRENAAKMGLDAEFVSGDIATLDLEARRFQGVFITALVYSFIPGRERRVRCLRQLGLHLARGGSVIYSAHLARRPGHVARLVAVAARRRLAGDRTSEFGDWFTWFVTPEGRLGKAYSHRFFLRDIVREARQAGFRKIDYIGHGHFVATEHQA